MEPWFPAITPDLLPEVFVSNIADALEEYVEVRDAVEAHRAARAAIGDFSRQAKALVKVLSNRAIATMGYARPTVGPEEFQDLRHRLVRTIAELPDEKSWRSKSGPTTRGRKQHARKVLRIRVLDALEEQQHIFKAWRPTAGRGPAGEVLKAVLREADRLDGRKPRERDAEIKLADWNRWIREWDQSAGGNY
jgi:hypothetical protein